MATAEADIAMQLTAVGAAAAGMTASAVIGEVAATAADSAANLSTFVSYSSKIFMICGLVSSGRFDNLITFSSL